MRPYSSLNINRETQFDRVISSQYVEIHHATIMDTVTNWHGKIDETMMLKIDNCFDFAFITRKKSLK